MFSLVIFLCIFLLIFVFFVCLCCFSFRSCFLILHLLSQMLRLEFCVNQHGLKRHHWSTSSWLTAPPQPISRRAMVTSLQRASLAFTCTAGQHLSYRTPLYVSVCLLQGLFAMYIYIYIYIYAFSRRFYPKRLTIAFRLYIFISTCVPWESNPQPFAQLTQCSTTEPHRNTCMSYWNKTVATLN